MNKTFCYFGEEIYQERQLRFQEPRCYTMLYIGLASVAVAGIGTGLSASGVGQPTQPNLAASSKELSDTNAAILPIQRGLTAAAQSGTDYTFSLPSGTDASSFGVPMSQAGWYDSNGNLVSTDNNAFGKVTAPPIRPNQSMRGRLGDKSSEPSKIPQGMTWRPATATLNGMPITRNADGTYTASFKGYGKADVDAANANKNAASQLALSQKYDGSFIDQALKEQKLADPQSFAARAEMSKLIQGQIDRPQNSPVSDMLSSQVQSTLDAAKNNSLTTMDKSRLSDAVTSALAARGGSGGAADMNNFEQPMTTGFAGEQRQAAAAQQGMGLLASGSSPEDIAYRREQQNLGNLSAEVNRRTPQSQFASMSGAQSGPTPMTQANPLPVLPNNEAGAQGVALQNWQTSMTNANNQVSPWMQGLSSLINVGSAAGNAGWKPFGTN